ncbi:MAG TPA: lysylphosphatidylglycerol synthase transmembrane domain-containing protein [Acidobacteriaceae bacterium]|nr:lysylphosphatidylglycerol synthase transmembrane domain-containing protein [Acidobacteriaceae bacterium]
MKSKRSRMVLLIVLVAIVALVWFGRHRIHFNWGVFVEQLRLADWRRIAFALGCIYVGYVIRAVRWALLVRHNRKLPLLSLLGTQVMGFTAVALIGRVADLVRPYLVAKKTGLPLSSQVAVYIVERLFDFGSMALIFSIAMIGVPTDEIVRATAHGGPVASLAQHHPMPALVIERYGGLILTVMGALFLIAVRVAGEAIASLFERGLGAVSQKLGHAAGNKVRTFHAGLDAMRSFGDFAAVSALSLGMWLLIALAYFQGCRAFVASPELAGISPSKCVLVMIASGGASMIQLPVIGWFSQIGLVMVTLTAVLGARPEAATACAATLLLVTFLGIMPVGLVWARFDRVSLTKVAVESEQAGEGLAHQAEPAG